MDLVNPDLVRAVADLPIVAILVFVMFGQFVLVIQQLRDLRNEMRRLSLALERVLLRFEDWLDKQKKE